LPCSVTWRTRAPAAAAIFAVSSLELLSNTQICASGSARAMSCTTRAMVTASL